MVKVINSHQEFLEKYLPITAQATKCSVMNRKEYLEWFMSVPLDTAHKVQDEMKRLAHNYEEKANHIYELIGG